MKRNFLFMALGGMCVAMTLTACKKEDQSARLMAEYEALSDNVDEQLDHDMTDEQYDSLINVFLDEALRLQQAAPESEAAYAILGDIYFMLDLEQKEQAFSVLNPDSIEARGLQRYYDAFRAEQQTAEGMTFTDFTAYTADGEAVAISSLVGQKDFLLIDFWASWCGPCRRAMPGLKELLAAHGDRLAVVGISVDEDPAAWQRTVADLELTWLQLRDTDDEGSHAYGITAIPHTVLIRRDGVILTHNPDPDDFAALLAE